MGDFGETEGLVVGGTGAGKTNGAWTAAVQGIQAALRVGDYDAGRRLFDRLIAGEFGQPTERPPQAPAGQPPGEWQAIIVDGIDSFTLADLDGNESDPEDVRVCLVHGTAVPVGGTLPRDLDPDDMLVEFDGFVALDQVEQRWAQAVAMAAGLNAAAEQKPDDCAGCYAWAEVAARTGFTIDDLRVRAAAWPAAYFTEDGDCSRAGLDELLRQAESEGTAAATAYADAYRFAARTIRETAAPAGEMGSREVAGLAGYFDRVADATDRAAGFYGADGEPLPVVTWADVEDAAAGSGCGELVEAAAALDPADVATLAGLLATLTPTGQPTCRTVDLFGAAAR